MKFKGVIFDLDGTVADTSADLSTGINLMLESLGFEKKSCEEIMRHINYGARKFVHGCLPDEIKNNKNYEDFLDEALRQYKEFYAEHYLDETRLYDGIAELVGNIYENKIKMCVLSNKHDEMTKKIMETLIDPKYFIEVLGGTERFPHKPKPDSALYLAGKMEVALCEILYIGDSDVDMNTAINAGMFPLGVTWGYRKENVVAEAGAKKIVYNPSEILQFILNN